MQEWVSVIIASLALLVSGVAARSSRRSARAAEKSALASTRAAAVAERNEERVLSKEEEDSVTWRVKRGPARVPSGTTPLTMTHMGTREERDVHVTLPTRMQVIGGAEPRGQTVAPRRSVQLEVAPQGDIDRDASVDIVWRVRENGRKYVEKRRWEDF